MSELQTAADESTVAPASSILPLVLIADPNRRSSTRRAGQLRDRGFRVAVARTPFEAIVKASCQLPDLILVAASLAAEGAAEAAELLSTCPATAHIPIVRLSAGGRLPARVLAAARI